MRSGTRAPRRCRRGPGGPRAGPGPPTSRRTGGVDGRRGGPGSRAPGWPSRWRRPSAGAPLRAVGPALRDELREMSYAESDTIHRDPADPHAYDGDNALLDGLDAAALRRVAALTGPAAPVMVVTQLNHLGGALASGPAGAVGHREARFALRVLSPLGEAGRSRGGPGDRTGGARRGVGRRRALAAGPERELRPRRAAGAGGCRGGGAQHPWRAGSCPVGGAQGGARSGERVPLPCVRRGVGEAGTRRRGAMAGRPSRPRLLIRDAP